MTARTLVVLQARMSSSRLPGKVMMHINNKPMIYWQIKRILKAKKVSSLVVATSLDTTDDVLSKFLEAHSINVYRGSLGNVLSRFIEVSEKYPHDSLIRLTGDCPLVMPELVDQMIEAFYEEGVDYLSNTLDPTYPDGLDIEIIKKGILEKLSTFNLEPKELEHVTFGIYKRPEIFKLSNYVNKSNQSRERWTVDYHEDFEFISSIFARFSGRETEFTLQEVNKYLEENPQIRAQNQMHNRTEQLQNEENSG